MAKNFLYYKSNNLPVYSKATNNPQYAEPDDCDCCGAGAPCTDCAGAQDPVASIATTGVGFCDGDFVGLPWDTFIDNSPDIDHCQWFWTKTGDTVPQLVITFNKVTKIYSGFYQATSFGSYAKTPITVTCNKATGKLTGTFQLNGVVDIIDCTGETADVTL